MTSAERERQRRADAGEPLPCRECGGFSEWDEPDRFYPQDRASDHAVRCHSCPPTGDQVCDGCGERPAYVETPHGDYCHECAQSTIVDDLRRSA